MCNKKVDFYEKNLERVNYWLQFAETKNAAIIAFIVAILAVIYSGDVFGNIWLKVILTAVYAVALVIALMSFLPQYKKNVDVSIGQYNIEDNVLFWNDIAKYSVEDYIHKVNSIDSEEESENPSNISEIERIYAEEIITNARIAQFKYNMFKIAVKVSISGIGLFTLFMIIVA